MTEKCFILILAFIAAVCPLPAHPPSAIDFSYDAPSQIVTVTITHPVKNTDEHFIHKIELKSGDRLLERQDLTFQTEPEHQRTVVLLARAVPGDVLSITAECNIFGKKTVTWTVPGGQ